LYEYGICCKLCRNDYEYLDVNTKFKIRAVVPNASRPTNTGPSGIISTWNGNVRLKAMNIKFKNVIELGVIFMMLATFNNSIVHADVLDDLPMGHWAAISKNTIKDVNPCPLNNCSYSGVSGIKGVIDAWNGGAFAEKYGVNGGLAVFGGGHKAYYGSEIYVFSLDSFNWERVTEPVENPACNETYGENQAGSACSAHTYDYVNYHPTTNSFVLLASWGDTTRRQFICMALQRRSGDAGLIDYLIVL